jgi:hypothetical protein
MPKYVLYKKLSTAIKKAVDYIDTHDAGVRSIEITGPHSGFMIEWDGYAWKSTPIER